MVLGIISLHQRVDDMEQVFAPRPESARGAQFSQPFAQTRPPARQLERSTAKSSPAGSSSVEAYFSAEASPTPGKSVRHRTSATRSFGVKGEAKEGDEVLHLGRVAQREATVFAIRNLLEFEGQLHRLDGSRGTRKHGDLGGLGAALDALAYPIHDERGFCHRGRQLEQFGPALVAAGAGQDQGAGTVLHHAVGEIENLLAGAIVLFEADDSRVGMFLNGRDRRGRRRRRESRRWIDSDPRPR